MIRRWLKPNAAGAILLVWFLGIQALCGGTPDNPFTIVTDSPTTWAHAFGFPVLVEVAGAPDTPTAVKIHWLRVIAVLGGAWIVTMALGRLMIDAGVDQARGPVLRPRRHPGILLMICVLAVVPVSFFGAVAASKLLWGHFFSTPETDAQVDMSWSVMFRLLLLVLLLLIVPLASMWLVIRRLCDRCRLPRGFPIEATRSKY
jgi:hypothetical protein